MQRACASFVVAVEKLHCWALARKFASWEDAAVPVGAAHRVMRSMVGVASWSAVRRSVRLWVAANAPTMGVWYRLPLHNVHLRSQLFAPAVQLPHEKTTLWV